MIVAQQKPIKDIAAMIRGFKKVALIGCGGCTTVCLSGGEKETEIMAASLRLMRRNEEDPLETVTVTVPRQCDPEFIASLESTVNDVEAVLSLACGVGVQYLAERFDKVVLPVLDTNFLGGSVAHGQWEEKCALCGDCILHITGGICPITRCPKSMLNGPCGGSKNGKCEIDSRTDCVWQLIYDRMKALGRLDQLKRIIPPKDWTVSRDGGPRRAMKEILDVNDLS